MKSLVIVGVEQRPQVLFPEIDPKVLQQSFFNWWGEGPFVICIAILDTHQQRSLGQGQGSWFPNFSKGHPQTVPFSSCE